MANTVIALKKSATPLSIPSNLANGELAINYADGKLYYKAANGTIASISGNEPNYFGSVNASGTFIVADTPGDILTLVAGNNVTIVGDAINDTITISANGGGGGASVVTDNVAPTSPEDGDLWWNSDLGKMFVYYVDGNTSQWVESMPGYVFSDGLVIGTAAFEQANTARDHANAAFNKANTAVTDFSPAFNQANLSYEQANTARDHANAAFNKANTAVTDFSPAFNQANIAYAQANVAYDAANTVGIEAEYAFLRANLAHAHANAAFETANTKLNISGGTITGNLAISGSLSVAGNAYTIDSESLRISDPLIYLAGNNYTSDIVDIGFVGNYVNTTGQNVHTGIFRNHENKEYYIFEGYDQEPTPNHIDVAGNNFTLSVLNASLKTSNIILGGANAILTIGAAFNAANTSGVEAEAAFLRANLAHAHANAAYTYANTIQGAVGGGNDKIFWENDSVVSANYSITAGRNAGTFGPITINSGVVVTVPSNSVWSIV